VSRVILKLDDTPRVAAERFRKRFLKVKKKQFIKLLESCFFEDDS
jgi:hypothetical protein